MALKDLVAQKASLTEAAIEEIISEYVRYDPEEKAIAFAPAAADLPSRAKVLIFLVALQGWRFVIDEAVPVDAKPAEITTHVGIQGGTLRPILKELKDRHVIAEKGGRYFVRPVSLTAIKTELGGTESAVVRPRTRRANKHTTKRVADAEIPAIEAKKESRRSPGKKTGNLAARFNKWIEDGFFDEPKTLADVQKRFHKEGAIVPQSSIPGYLLKAIRSGRLTREEAEINKKRVWVYQRER